MVYIINSVSYKIITYRNSIDYKFECYSIIISLIFIVFRQEVCIPILNVEIFFKMLGFYKGLAL